MMNKSGSTFASSLEQHDGRRLKVAFENCNRLLDIEPYDRSALNRWQKGALPGRREFVVALAAQLDDPSIIEIWDTANASAESASDEAAVLTRFRGLDDDSRMRVFAEVQSLIRGKLPLRSDYYLRVELHDSHEPDLFRCRIALDYRGPITENAWIVIGSREDDQRHIWKRKDCIFREMVDRSRDELARAISDFRGEDPVLLITPSRSSHEKQYLAKEDHPGFYQFSNPAADLARVKLRVSYPYPREITSYPVRFPGYQVKGPATLTLVLYSRGTTLPKAHAFFADGREWDRGIELPGHEFVVTAGAEGDILQEGAGVMFHWSDRNE